jgi:hypothetical protein
MKNILLSLLIVISFTIFTNLVSAQNPPDTLWTKLITNFNNGWAADIRPTSQGGCILIADFEHPVTGNTQICILKFDPNGSEIKRIYLGDNGLKNVMAHHISPTSDGNAIIVGTDLDNQKAMLIRIDDEADTLWTKTYFEWPDLNQGRRVVQTSAGFVILSLARNAQNTWYDLLIFTDQSGNYLTAIPFGDEGNLYPADMVLTADNCFVVLSRLEAIGNHNFITLFKAEATGYRYWNRYLIIPNYQNNAFAYTLKQSSDNGFLIGGTVVNPSYYQLGLIAKTYPDGIMRQYKIYGDTTANKDYDIESFIEMPDQGILSVGETGYYSNPIHMMMMRTNSQMDTLYYKYLLFPEETFSYLHSIQKCADGNIFTSGRIDFSNSSAVFVAKIGSDIPSVVNTRSNLGLPISDNNVTTDILNYVGLAKNQTSTLLGVDVMIDTVLHTSTGDLEFTLSHNGIIDTLIYHAGESGDNFIQAILSDIAQSPVNIASAPFTGFYRPTSSLSNFYGVDPTGNWTLSILDNVAGNTGMLNAWGLRFYFESPSAVDDGTPEIISDYMLYQNYPNPFNPSTKISWQSPIGSWQTLKIYDVLANEIATLVNEEKPAGEYEVEFQSAVGSRQLASGIYFYQLKAGEFIQTKKMILLK